MKIKRSPYYKGYIPILRAILLKLSKSFGFSDLGAYLFFVTQADFDPRHKDTYRMLVRTDEELAQIAKCSPVTIFRYRKKLIKMKLLYEKEKNTYLPNFAVFDMNTVKQLVKLEPQNVKELFTVTQENITEMIESISEVKECSAQIESESFRYSSKGGNDLSDEDITYISDLLNGK